MVGALLLRPERVRAGVHAPTFAGIGSDLLTVLAVAVADAGRVEPRIPPALEAAFAGLGARLVARMGTGIAAAGERVGAVVDPLLQALVGPVEDAAGGPAAIAGALGDLLVEGVGAVASLDAEVLQAAVEEIFDAVTGDLGLTVEVLREELFATADELAAALAPSEPAFAAALGRLVRRLDAVPLPELDPGALARLALEALRDGGLDRAAELASCMAASVTHAAGHAEALVGGVPFSGSGTRSVGAAAAARAAPSERHAWYATWLLGQKRPPGPAFGLSLVPWEGADEVWVADGQVTRRNAWRAGQPLGPGDDWTDALIFDADSEDADLAAHGFAGHVTFGRDEPEKMEDVALWTAVAAHGLEALLHAYSLEEGDYASNAGQILTNTLAALTAGTTRRPLPWWLDHLFLRTLVTLVASLEGRLSQATPGNRFAFWLTLAGPDLGEVVRTHLLVHAVRDLVLSTMTLRNHTRASGDERKAQNRFEWRGYRRVAVLLAAMSSAAFVSRKDYKLPFLDAANTVYMLAYWLVVTSILAGMWVIVGWLVGRLWADDLEDGDDVEASAGATILGALFAFWPVLFHLNEGATSRGTYNPYGPPDFAGYPDPKKSPYRLPWAQGRSIYAGQSNLGIFSHHVFGPGRDEVYAYDFGHDFREPVLAARPGTVVYYWQKTLDGEETFDDVIRDNSILIRHDVDDDGNPIPPDPEHDLGPGGQVVRTYARYRHGAHLGVTAAFGFEPVDERRARQDCTPQTRVRQGQPIMLAGDTGSSFHNHLHMEVLPDDGTGDPTEPDDECGFFISPDNADQDPTLPFVFADLHHAWNRLAPRSAGVPYRLNFYTAGG